MKLKPRQFNWDKREWYARKANGTKMQQTPTAGFIAQELDKLQTIEKVEWLNLVLKENPNRLEATMGNLLPIIVKAVQEVKEENDKFKNEANERIGKLEKENKKLAEMNLKLHKDIASLSSSITDQVREAVKAVLLKSTRSDDAAVKVSMNTK
jgi:hypothetical protein